MNEIDVEGTASSAGVRGDECAAEEAGVQREETERQKQMSERDANVRNETIHQTMFRILFFPHLLPENYSFEQFYLSCIYIFTLH